VADVRPETAVLGIDPMFRAHPERSFPAVAGGFYWGDI
jgi:hypothetical protein